VPNAYLCPFCHVRATFTDHASVNSDQGQHHLLSCNNCQNVLYATGNPGAFVFVFPETRETASEDYPEDVRDNLTEALRSLMVGNYKACVIMTRGALQSATRELGAKGKSLYDEIGDLATRNVIPQSLKEWAHEIRDAGNLVAHPEPSKRIEKQDAEELLALAESIFQYVYVIPKQVQERRDRVSQGAISFITSYTP
jgi:hypothetical protein